MKRTPLLKIGLANAIILILSTHCFAEELLKTTHSWSGGEIIYPTGAPEIISEKLILSQGITTGFHCHPIPTLAYVVKGKLEVETIGGQTQQFVAGQSFVEAQKTIHRGHVLKGPVEIIVFYTGSVGNSTTLLANDQRAKELCQY